MRKPEEVAADLRRGSPGPGGRIREEAADTIEWLSEALRELADATWGSGREMSKFARSALSGASEDTEDER